MGRRTEGQMGVLYPTMNSQNEKFRYEWASDGEGEA